MSQQTTGAGEVDPRHARQVVGVGVQPRPVAERPDGEHDYVEASGPRKRLADRTGMGVEFVGVDRGGHDRGAVGALQIRGTIRRLEGRLNRPTDHLNGTMTQQLLGGLVSFDNRALVVAVRDASSATLTGRGEPGLGAPSPPRSG